VNNNHGEYILKMNSYEFQKEEVEDVEEKKNRKEEATERTSVEVRRNVAAT